VAPPGEGDGPLRRDVVAEILGQVGDVDEVLLAEHGRALQDVGQLTDVARPAVLEEELLDLAGDAADALAEALVGDLEEMADEQGDVLEPFPEGRQVDDDLVEAVEEVLPEGAGPDPFGQVPVRGGQDPDLDRRALARAERPELAVLQDAEELGLDGHGDLGDLVEEDDPAVGLLEQARLVPVGPGEGALAIAEQLRFEEVLGDGGAVADDERLVLVRAQAVDGPGDDLLAGPRLARDERAREVLGDVLDEPEDLEHGRIAADEALEDVLALQPLLEVQRLPAELALAGYPAQEVAEDVAFVGLGDEVGRPGEDDPDGVVADDIEVVVLERAKKTLTSIGDFLTDSYREKSSEMIRRLVGASIAPRPCPLAVPLS